MLMRYYFTSMQMAYIKGIGNKNQPTCPWKDDWMSTYLPTICSADLVVITLSESKDVNDN